ncbi:hypothetical protein [Clostridium beijerinckii]|uniref:hypothetical protein n=1 Tax=Clostridium beijerinckii TaxID=1520 RepID=UPI00233062B1|nr:hypothetical protein [Clostridium beijerinckii]
MSTLKNYEIYCEFTDRKVKVKENYIITCGKIFPIRCCYVLDDESNIKEIIHTCKHRDNGECILT